MPVQQYNNIYDMYYDLFMECGFAVNRDQYMYDQDTSNMLMFREHNIKASLDGSPVYAGKNDVIFDPAHNYTLMSMIFCHYLDKVQDTDDGDILQGFVAYFIEDDITREKQRVVIRTKGRGDIASNFYYNIYLAYIDCMFRITNNFVDLNNFDIKPEKEEKGKRGR